MTPRMASLLAALAAALMISFFLPESIAPRLQLEHDKRTRVPASPSRDVMKRARNTRSIPINANLIIRRVAPGSPDGPIDFHHQPWDWVEIYNRSEHALSLDGYSLSDDPDRIRKFRFPSISLPPASACRVWLSGFTSMGSRWSLTPSDIVRSQGWKPVSDQDLAHRSTYMWLGFLSPESRPSHDPQNYRIQLPVEIHEPGRYGVWLHAGVRGSRRSRLHVRFNQTDLDVVVDDPETLSYVPLTCPTSSDGYWELTEGSHTLLGTVVEGDTLVNELAVFRYSEPIGQGTQDLHAAIKLKQSGEFIGLFDPAGVAIDHVITPPLPTGMMAIRDPEHTATLRLEPVRGHPLHPPPPQPRFNPAAGRVSAGTPVTISCDDPTSIVRYTLDGRLPSQASPQVAGPLPIDSNTVLRARAFTAMGQAGPIAEASYWVDAVSNLPVLSVIVEPDQLYDFSQGILYNTSIRGLLSERRCHLTLIETDGGATTASGGMRIQGRSSREAIAKRNFRFVFRDRYGHPYWPGTLFPGEGPNRCRSVVAAGRNLVRNQLAHALMDEARVRSPRRRPARLYLNGKPFGLYLLLEDVQDPNYLEHTFGHLDLDVIKEKTFEPVKWGSRRRFDRELLPYIERGSEPITYETLAGLMDVDLLCRWMVVIQYAGVDDSGQGYYIRDGRATGPPWTTVNWDFDNAFTMTPDQGWPLPQGFRSRLLLPVKNASATFQRQHYFPAMQQLLNHVLPRARLSQHGRELIGLYEPLLDEEYDAHLNQRCFGDHAPDRDVFLTETYRNQWAQLLSFIDTRFHALPDHWGINLFGGKPCRVQIEIAAACPGLVIDSWPAPPSYTGVYYPGTTLSISWEHPDQARPLVFEINGTLHSVTGLHTNVTTDLEIRIRGAGS